MTWRESPAENDVVINELADTQVLSVVRVIFDPVANVPVLFFCAFTDAVTFPKVPTNPQTLTTVQANGALQIVTV
jgi:hypothetical protein